MKQSHAVAGLAEDKRGRLVSVFERYPTIEAVRLNEVVYATPTFHRGTVYSNVVRRYLDIKYYLDRQRARSKERMLDGSG